MPKTGQTCTRSAVYQGKCPCRVQAAVAIGDTFPVCRQCKQPVVWSLAENVE